MLFFSGSCGIVFCLNPSKLAEQTVNPTVQGLNLFALTRMFMLYIIPFLYVDKLGFRF